MDLPPVESLEPDQLLDELVTAYLKAVEAGQTPDRQQWLVQYLQLAADLAAFFADQDRWERLTAPMRAALGPPLEPDETPPGRGAKSEADLRLGSDSGWFGDYELLAEIGRGWTKTSGPISFEIADTYGQFAELHLCQDGVIH